MADIRIPLTLDERRALKQRATAIDSSIRKVVQKLIRAYLTCLGPQDARDII